MQVKGYKHALNYLEGFIGKIIFKVSARENYDPLGRMRILLSLLGNPQDKFKSVLVGGTAGKGSTAYLISHILTASGYKTGFTVSPHLQKVNERLQINGKEISDLEFTKMVNSIVQTIELMKKMPASPQGGKIGAPSYFEIIVGMAFKYFAKEKVDIAVAEVGMGGEFDATNTLNPLAAVLTNVGLDHTNILGKTVEKIARTKAGIIKKSEMRNEKLEIKGNNNSHLSSLTSHLVVVSGVRQPSVVKIIEKKCEDTGAKLNLLWRDFGYKIKKESLKGSVFDLITSSGRTIQLNDLQLSLIGRYQVENASLAVKTVLKLEKFGFKISDEAIKKALKTAFFPGRFEILRLAPLSQDKTSSTLILDGAHNPTKMRAFLSTLKKLFPKEPKVFIVGFKFDKDIKKMLKEILGAADEIIITEFKAKTDTNVHASADASDIKNEILKIKKDSEVIIERDSKKALEKALNILKTQYPNDPSAIIVTGSLYLVGEVRSML